MPGEPAPAPGGYPAAPSLLADGRGGVLLVWEADIGTARCKARNVRIQHVLVRGQVDPAWPPGGLELGVVPFAIRSHVAISDGAGGAIVAWDDCRKGKDLDVCAQHVLADGRCDPAWPAGGRVLCAAVRDQHHVAIAPDGAGGAIAVWADGRRRRHGEQRDLYAQHVTIRGELDSLYPADGRRVCTAPGNRSPEDLVADGRGGAIVVWIDWRRKDSDLYARHLASGEPDSTWLAPEVPVCTAEGDQWACRCAPDGAGGALVAWEDYRLGKPMDYGQVFAQHVTAEGAPDSRWPADGRNPYAGRTALFSPTLAEDGSGGAFVACEDYEGGERVSVQHVLTSGPDPAWPAEGLSLRTSAGWEHTPVIVADGSGGAIAAWMDDRNDRDHDASLDIFAQHATRDAQADPSWPAHGVAVCAVPGLQGQTVIASDGAGGAFVGWLDDRPGAHGVYVQHVLAAGRWDPAWPENGLEVCGPTGS